MAGAGFKTFNTGDVLTASDVNTYLMQQTVMVFASAAARTTALGANVAEGMLSYLKDTDVVEVYNGSAWVSSDDPNAIQNTIVDAKGDLISATAADTPARLAVGTNGTVLVADSTASTGLAWNGESTSYTPTLTNITLGNGTSTATYVRHGNLVCLTGKITLGSTTTIAAGAKISLPVNAKLTKVQSASVHYQDTGTNDIVGFFLIDSASTARFYVIDASATYSVYQGISGTIPFTWASTDEIIYNLVYEVA